MKLKILTRILAGLMLSAILLTALVSCKKDNEPDDPDS